MRKWGLTCFSVASLEGIGAATGSPDPLSHFSPVANFVWCHFSIASGGSGVTGAAFNTSGSGREKE